MTVVGSNTQFIPGSTQLWAGPGISVGGAPVGEPGPVTVQDATHLTASLSLQPTTVLGPRTLLAITGGERAALVGGFTVLAGTPPVAGTTVTTWAGTGSPGLVDGPGTTARFRLPFDVAGRADGRGVVADTGNSRLRELAADGTVSTVALPVTLRLPLGVALDAAGRRVVADTASCVIRIVQADGSVTTIGQAGACGFADGAAATARFRFPRDVAVDGAGNLVVADAGTFRVRRIAPDGTVSTLAGSGAFGSADGPAATATFGLLSGVAVAPDGTVFVTDAVFHRLRQIDPAGQVTTVAGTGVAGFADGPAATAQFAFPTGLARDATGTLYVADTLNHLIRRLTPAGVVETLAGTGAPGRQDGPGETATFTLPAGVGLLADAPGQVLVADTGSHTIRRVVIGPVVTGVSPTSVVHGTTIAAFTVTGTSLFGATRVEFLRDGVPDPALAATGLQVSADGRQLTAAVDLAATASLGSRTVTVTTPGGTSDAALSPATTVTVLGRLTLVPDFQTLKAGTQGSLTVQLSAPAPASGLTVALESAAPSIVTVTSPVTIAAGATSGTATVSAVAAGTTNFTASAPGFANGLAAITVVLNQAPTLAPIGSPTAPLGQTLAFTVSGSDPDGDPVSFGVSPLPLPAHATFDRLTGRFTFTPAADQVGSFTLTFRVTDGEATAAETITITVPPAPLTGVTAFAGRVLDANAFAAGLTVPVVGATVSFLGTGRSALTDAQGFVTVTGLPAGQQVLDINPATAQPAPDGSRYAGFREAVALIANVTTTVERPFFLPRLDAASLTPVDPATTTVVHNAALGVTLTVPPHTAKDAAGNDFTGQLSISLVPRNLAPAALPETLDPGLLITIQPVGVTFATPVPITFPNVDGLTPGSEVDIWSLDAKRGVFAVVGPGRVSADGSRIETIAGGIRAADWHAPLPPGPAPTGGPGPGPTGPGQCTTCPVASSVTVHNGGLLADQTLPGVRSLGVSRSLQLVYNSTTADVRPIVPLDALLSVRAAVPPRFSAALEVGGVAQGGRVFYDSAGLPENADSSSRLALQVDGRALPTGRYPFTARVFSHYPQSAVGAVLTDQFLVVNHRSSPLGAGWGLAGLQRLHEQPDGSLVLTEGDGTATAFAPSPAENVSAIQYTLVPNGGFEAGTGTGADGFSPVGPAVLRRAAETTLVGQFALALDPSFSLPAGQPGAAMISGPLPVTPGVPYVLSGFIFNGIIGGGAAYLDLADAVVDPTLTRPDAPTLSTSGLGAWEFVSIRFTPQVTSVQVRAVVDGGTGAIQAGSQAVFDQLALTPASQFHRPPPPTLVPNGDFETGLLTGFTPSAIKGGGVGVAREGTQFSADPFPPAGVPSYLVPFTGTFAAILASAGPGVPVDSVGMLTSDPFLAGRRVAFLERSESRDVAIEVRVLDSTDQVLISQPIAEPSTDRWTRRSVDTRGLVGQTIRLQVRQHTLRTGFGFYTLIDDLVADFAPTLFVSPAGDFSTVARNPDGTVTRTLKDGTRIQFDAQGRQTAVVDRNGNTTAYAYDAAGRLTTVTDPVGQGTTLTYDGSGLLQALTDSAGRVTTVAHDAAGNLTQLTNPDGSQVGYAYDAEHRLVAKTDEAGQVTRYAYDVAGRLATVTHPTGEGRQVQPTETQGLVNPAGGQGSFATPAPIVRSEAVKARLTDGLGHATTFTVNRFGAPLTQTDPVGRVTTTVRNAANVPTQVTRPTGAVTTMTYDSRGNLLTTTEPAIGATTSFTYEPAFNQATSITDPKGHQTTIAYDATGNPTQVTDALGHVTTQTYDARGLLTSTRDPLNQLTSFTYDAKGNLVSTTDPLGRVTSLGYDAAGNVVASTDALGRVTQFAYDAMNRLTEVTDAAGGVTHYAYDPKGRLVTVTDARGQTTTFAYNAVGQLVQTTNPVGQVKRFQYDLGRNLVLVIDAKGQRLEFSYDAANQLVQKVLKDAVGVVTDTVTLAYDPLGDLASAADADSHLTLTYDPVGRLTQVQTAATSAQPASTIGYTYDLSGNRLTMTDPQGAVTTYAYDALNRLITLTSPDGPTTFAYDALGRRTGLTRPNGTQTTATYDAASQLTDLAHALGADTISRAAYTYNAVGNRDTRTTPTGVSAYTYDALNRLTQAQQPDPVDPLQVLNESFAYDPVGNRTASHLATGQVHDAANRLLGDSAFTFQYDANGNLTTRTAKATGATTTYVYDGENRLVAVSGPGLTASYAYDPLGRRIAKTVNGVVTRYVYDQEDLLLEYTGATVPQARYTHGPGIDEPLARTDGTSGQTVFYHVDGLGSITELTDGTGAVVQRYQYDAFGALLASPGTVAQPYTFTAREFDAETGLYYYRARYYDTTTGRFMQEDPILQPGDPLVPFLLPFLLGDPAKLHAYVYVKNDPISLTDPTGLLSECCSGAWIGKAFRFVNVWCRCYWLCVPPEGVIWSGNWFGLPATSGMLVFTGGGGLRRGDACLCNDPKGVPRMMSLMN